VLVLVGDAPPHEADEQKALALARAFARDRHSVLDVLYTGWKPGTEPTERDAASQKTLERLARSANGQLTNLQAGEDDLRGLILDASFGTEWREDIRELLAHPRDDWRERIVAGKVRLGKRAWLLENLGRMPVHPSVVEGCLQLFDPAIAQHAHSLVLDETQPTPVRSVSLYVLKRKLGAKVVLDTSLPLQAQAAQVAVLQRAVSNYAKGDRRAVPPAPAPGAAAGSAPAPGAAPGAAPGSVPAPAPGAEPGSAPGAAPGSAPVTPPVPPPAPPPAPPPGGAGSEPDAPRRARNGLHAPADTGAAPGAPAVRGGG
jgi:hypothetical protein